MVAPAVARPARPAPARALGGGLPTTTGPASVLRTHRCVHPAAPSGAHLKIVLGRSSTLLLRASPTLKSHGSHPPAAAGCRSPRQGRCGTGAGHGRQGTRVTTGFIRRVPARVPACGCFQGQAAPHRSRLDRATPAPYNPTHPACWPNHPTVLPSLVRGLSMWLCSVLHPLGGGGHTTGTPADGSVAPILTKQFISGLSAGAVQG